MRTRITAGLAALAAGVAVAGFGLGPAAAQPPDKDKGPDKAADRGPAPKFLYGHDLKVRPGGEKDFPKALKIGVEVFQHEVAEEVASPDGKGAPARKTTAFAVGISDSGVLGVFPAGPVGGDRVCKWQTAHDLKVRKAGELEFTQKTKAWGVEVYRDLGSNRLLYACESGAIAFAPAPGTVTADRRAEWHHALETKVRSPEQDTFDAAKKFGLEVFKDGNTGGLIYATEAGFLATAPAPPSPPDRNKVAPPKPAYGLILRVRAADEGDFSDKTRRVAVEVFEDPNANTLMYVTETGSLAVVPNPGKFADVKGPAALTWLSAINLPARKGGEKDFAKAKKYGVEIVRDNRTGNLMFIGETGAIAVLTR